MADFHHGPSGVAGQKAILTWAVHISVAVLVILWVLPTLGLFISSFRTADQISSTGWWKAPFATEQTLQGRTGGEDAQVQEGDLYVIEGNLLEDGQAGKIGSWGVSSRDIAAYQPGVVKTLTIIHGNTDLIRPGYHMIICKHIYFFSSSSNYNSGPESL